MKLREIKLRRLALSALAFAPILLFVSLEGCEPAPAVAAATHAAHANPSSREIVAIDTSGSARESFPLFERKARDINDALPNDSEMEIYRFDTGVNEIYVGGPLGAKEFKQTLRHGLESDRHSRGTNLLKMAHRIDERLAETGPCHLTVLTDCGIEGMSTIQHEELRRIVKRWKTGKKITGIDFVGVRAMHHDALRRDFAPLGKLVSIL